jgi:hypothetical protein
VERSLSSELRPDVQQLIDEHISSLEQLEILLLLQRNKGRDWSAEERDWSAEEIARELRITSASTARRLLDLERRGFLKGEAGRYQYQPDGLDRDGALEELSRLYPEWRVRIIGRIFSKPMDNIRTFADAFRLRKDKNDG